MVGRDAIKKIGLELFTRADRHQTISGINEAVTASGGYVDDVNFFSNIAVAIVGIVPTSNGERLVNALSEIGLKLSDREMNQLAKIDDESSTGDEFICSMHVTFLHSDRDLRQHILHVPG